MFRQSHSTDIFNTVRILAPPFHFTTIIFLKERLNTFLENAHLKATEQNDQNTVITKTSIFQTLGRTRISQNYRLYDAEDMWVV